MHAPVPKPKPVAFVMRRGQVHPDALIQHQFIEATGDWYRKRLTTSGLWTVKPARP